MNPANYSDDILNREFVQLFTYDDETSFQIGARYHNIPERFTLREARDGKQFVNPSYPDGFLFKITAKSKLERLRCVKPGEIVAMNFKEHFHNRWYVKLADPIIENKMTILREKIKKLDTEIEEVAGDLIAESAKLKIQYTKLQSKLNSGTLK